MRNRLARNIRPGAQGACGGNAHAPGWFCALVVWTAICLVGQYRAFGGDVWQEDGLGQVVAAVTLVESGQSQYVIVVEEEFSPVRFAAEELQRYVRLISDVELPLAANARGRPAIYVGQNRALAAQLSELRKELASRGDDGYMMQSRGDDVILLGNSPRGTLYAVYDFLEVYLGCGWCVPGDDAIPRSCTIRMPPVKRAVGPPAMSGRRLVLYPYGSQAHGSLPGEWLKKINLPHVDWLTKNRLNWVHAAPNGPGIWEASRSREILVPEVEKRGLHLQVGGHTFTTWVPPSKYAATHPEYFALRGDGKRADGGTNGDSSLQVGLCISNPEVVKLVAENMSTWLAANPEVDAVDLWHSDSRRLCVCSGCIPKGFPDEERSVTYTRTYIKFANQVAELVRQRHPTVLVNLLAYLHTQNWPPNSEQISDNVLVGLCLFGRERQRTMRPLETSTQPLDGQLREQLPLWRKQAKHFYVYEYYSSENPKWWSMLSMISEDIRYFQRLGVDAVSSDQWGPHWNPLNMYAFGRLMWNPQLKIEDIITDFCRRYYGDAAEPMIAYWSLLEQGLCESWANEDPFSPGDNSLLHAKLRELATKALSKSNSEVIAARVRATAVSHRSGIDAQ